ncbi:MAG: peptidase M75 [Prevotellaceae bacterium]|nr:peptidase M75 [Prevotellaceae bacterium]
MKTLTVMVCAVTLVLGFTSCNTGGEPDGDPNLEILSQAVPQYVNHTVIATYTALADETIALHDALTALKASKAAGNDQEATANLQAAADKWLAARHHWELSEAFLYGAAGDFGIDPHIDTWPLDRTALEVLLNNNDNISSMDSEDGVAWAGEYLGSSLLGFHGIEYILFVDGAKKNASAITNNELIYAVAVSGDLRNQCIRLEAAWAGYDNVSEEKQAVIDDFELGITIGNNASYGADMINAGKTGSTYISVLDAVEALLEGCVTIADEVGTLKIGQPYSGEDVNYIESPYSYNSLIDFVDNIESIRNAYLGGADAAARGVSVSDYFKKVNVTLDGRVIAAIDNAVAKIQAIQHPFFSNYASSQAGEAVEACDELASVLTEAKNALRE